MQTNETTMLKSKICTQRNENPAVEQVNDVDGSSIRQLERQIFSGENLQAFIRTPHSEFNRFALKLYLENTKTGAFPDREHPLLLFSFIHHKMLEHGYDIFTFIALYEQVLEENNVSLNQNLLLCGIVKSFLKMISRRDNRFYEPYYEDYLSYFTMLEEVAIARHAETTISNTDIAAMLNDVIQKQVLKLSGDLAQVPATQKVRAIATLVKVMPQYIRLKNEPSQTVNTKTDANEVIHPIASNNVIQLPMSSAS